MNPVPVPHRHRSSCEPCGSLNPLLGWEGSDWYRMRREPIASEGVLPSKKPAFPGGAPRAKATHPPPTPHMSLRKKCQKVTFLRRQSDELNGGMHVGGRIGMKSPGGIPPPPPKPPGGGYPPSPPGHVTPYPVSFRAGSQRVPFGSRVPQIAHGPGYHQRDTFRDPPSDAVNGVLR